MIAEIMKGQRITQKFVESTLPTGRDFVLWDRDLKGFGLKVTASGSKGKALPAGLVDNRQDEAWSVIADGPDSPVLWLRGGELTFVHQPFEREVRAPTAFVQSWL